MQNPFQHLPAPQFHKQFKVTHLVQMAEIYCQTDEKNLTVGKEALPSIPRLLHRIIQAARSHLFLALLALINSL